MRTVAYASFGGLFALTTYTAFRYDATDWSAKANPSKSDSEVTQRQDSVVDLGHSEPTARPEIRPEVNKPSLSASASNGQRDAVVSKPKRTVKRVALQDVRQPVLDRAERSPAQTTAADQAAVTDAVSSRQPDAEAVFQAMPEETELTQVRSDELRRLPATNSPETTATEVPSFSNPTSELRVVADNPPRAEAFASPVFARTAISDLARRQLANQQSQSEQADLSAFSTMEAIMQSWTRGPEFSQDEDKRLHGLEGANHVPRAPIPSLSVSQWVPIDSDAQNSR